MERSIEIELKVVIHDICNNNNIPDPKWIGFNSMEGGDYDEI